MVDPEFAEHQLPGVRLLVASGIFPHDAELTMNRLLTERRAELYRVGSELSRALSTASISGTGLDALLDGAATVAARELILQDDEGALLASSRGARDGSAPSGSAIQRVLRGADGESSRIVESEGSLWLAQPIAGANGRPARRGSVLSIEIRSNSSREAPRLILAQTAAAVELMLGQGRDAGRAANERANRESLVADLLLGRLVSREAADARARLLGLDPTRATRVALLTSTAENLPARVRSALPLDRRLAAAALDGGEFALAFADPALYPRDMREIIHVARTLRAQDPSLLLVLSEEVRGASNAAAALSQARALARLSREGALDGDVIDAGDAATVGLFGLLYPLWLGHDLDRPTGRERMRSFARVLLGPLEEHDRKRRSDLVATLDAWMRHGGALADAAAELNVHRNTLAYRLGRIEQLAGLELSDTRTLLLLRVALAVRVMERTLDGG